MHVYVTAGVHYATHSSIVQTSLTRVDITATLVHGPEPQSHINFCIHVHVAAGQTQYSWLYGYTYSVRSTLERDTTTIHVC